MSILSGLRIVEYSAFVAVPLAGLTLAQLGAEVIRVDPLGGNIDIGREPRNAQGRSLYWASLNCGKQSVELDTRSEAGRRLLRRLVLAGEAPQQAGRDGPPVFMTNLPVDGELSYASMAAQRPDLIMVRLHGSPDGKNAVDYTVNCAVGLPAITGNGAHPVVNHVLPAWDVGAGLTLALAILAAERHWRATGEGQLIELSLSDVAMATVSNLGYLAEFQVNGTERKPDGNYVYGAYGGDFATADDRRVMVAAITNRQWQTLLRAMDMAQPMQASAEGAGFRLDSEADRYEAREFISAVLRPWFRRRTLAQIAQVFDPAGILWSPYRTFKQMLAEDPRCSPANPMFAMQRHPGYGDYLTAGSPLRFSAAPAPRRGVGPRLGQDTAAVLRSVMGASAQEIAQLAQAGLISPSTDS